MQRHQAKQSKGRKNFETYDPAKVQAEMTMCFRKTRYESERIALREGDHLGDLNGKRFKTYRCPHCKRWHLATDRNV